MNYLFSLWILLYQNVFGLKISMNDTAFVKIADCLDDLMHADGDFPLFELVRLDMLEQLTACHLLHDDVHVLLCFVRFLHLDNVWMGYQLDDLDFFTEEVSFSGSQLAFDNLLSRYQFLCLLVLTLVND